MKPYPKTKKITLMWVRGHIDIKGNEIADKQAKIAATNSEFETIPGTSYKDIKKHINDIIQKKWLNTWKQQFTKLNTIKTSTMRWINTSLKRKEETVLNRLRIGHTQLTHGYLMAKEEPPACEVCGVQLTVKHIITECLKYEHDRQTIGLDTTLEVALGPETEENTKMLLFLKTTGLYNLI